MCYLVHYFFNLRGLNFYFLLDWSFDADTSTPNIESNQTKFSHKILIFFWNEAKDLPFQLIKKKKVVQLI
jgi:hypothetical protein